MITAHIQTYYGITDGWQTVTTRRTKQEAEALLLKLSLIRPHFIHRIARAYS